VRLVMLAVALVPLLRRYRLLGPPARVAAMSW